MRLYSLLPLLICTLLAGCSTSPPPIPRQASPDEADSPLGTPLAEQSRDPLFRGAPLILDRTDLRFGTTVHLTHIPTRQELYDFHIVSGLAHVVITLSQWPTAYAKLQELDQAPEEADLIVILPGYPPSQQAAEAWIVRRGVGDRSGWRNDAGHGAVQRSIPLITVMTQALGRR